MISFVGKHRQRMKHVLALALTLVTLSVAAQQKHFIYIQSDNQQPFYVKLDKKIMSSTTAGYIIIPKLVAGPYNFTIGFPKNEWPEQKVTCQVTETDAGYILKNFGEKGWGLFNFQTMDLLMANNDSRQDPAQQNQDAFASTLSNVVNDPSIKTSAAETASEKEKTRKTEEKQTAERVKESVAVQPEKETNAAKPAKEKKTDTKQKTADTKAPAGPAIRRIRENLSADSASFVYVDNSKGGRDTIDVIIPATAVSTTPAEIPVRQPQETVSVPVVKTDPVVQAPAITKPANQVTDEPEAPNKVVITSTPVTDTIAGLGARPLTGNEQNTVVNEPARVSDSSTFSREIINAPLISDPAVRIDSTAAPSAITKTPKQKKQKTKKKNEEAPAEIPAVVKNVPGAVVDTALAQTPPVMEEAAEKNAAKEVTKPVLNEEQPKASGPVKKSRKKKEDKKQPEELVQEPAVKQPGETVISTPVTQITPAMDTVSNTVTVNTQPVPVQKMETPAAPVLITNPGPDSVAILKQAYDSLQRVMVHMADSLNEVVRIKAEQDSLKALAVAELKQKSLADSLQREKERQALAAAELKQKALADSLQREKENQAKAAAARAKEQELDQKPAPLDKPVVTAGSATCKQYVDDDEYLNLRKKMDKNRDNENEMLFMAHKVFEKRCFSTKQIQRLSLLFASDSGKYKLFDDAYQYTYDKENFASLESELTDEYYKKRFRVMLR